MTLGPRGVTSRTVSLVQAGGFGRAVTVTGHLTPPLFRPSLGDILRFGTSILSVDRGRLVPRRPPRVWSNVHPGDRAEPTVRVPTVGTGDHSKVFNPRVASVDPGTCNPSVPVTGDEPSVTVTSPLPVTTPKHGSSNVHVGHGWFYSCHQFSSGSSSWG